MEINLIFSDQNVTFSEEKVDLKDNVKVGAGLIKVCVLGGGGDPGDLLTWSLHTLV